MKDAELLILKFRMMDEQINFLEKMYGYAKKELGEDFLLAFYENEYGKVPKKYAK